MLILSGIHTKHFICMHVIFNLFLLVFFSYLFYHLACVTVEVCVDQNEQESFKKQSFLGTTKTTKCKCTVVLPLKCTRCIKPVKLPFEYIMNSIRSLGATPKA